MEKVGVKFDLMYISEERAVVQTMKQAAKNGAIADLLVYPDSLSIDSKYIFHYWVMGGDG